MLLYMMGYSTLILGVRPVNMHNLLLTIDTSTASKPRPCSSLELWFCDLPRATVAREPPFNT